MKRFEGKSILVTGAGSGIGAACVERLIEEGAIVYGVDASESGLQVTADVVKNNDRFKPVVVDVTKREAVIEMVGAAYKEQGQLNGLINCAGIPGVGTIFDTDPDFYEKVMSVNLNGTLNFCHAFATLVKNDSYTRAIVNTSSGAGVLGIPNRVPYVASKFAVSGLTKSMCPELGEFGIRINAVAPGYTKTPLVNHVITDPEALERVNKMHPIGRCAEPSEIAAVMIFLLTEDASFMTGAVVSVDGGQTAVL